MALFSILAWVGTEIKTLKGDVYEWRNLAFARNCRLVYEKSTQVLFFRNDFMLSLWLLGGDSIWSPSKSGSKFWFWANSLRHPLSPFLKIALRVATLSNNFKDMLQPSSQADSSDLEQKSISYLFELVLGRLHKNSSYILYIRHLHPIT